MKKTIKKADGTQVVVEGSFEEIVNYEKLHGETKIKESPKPAKPGLLLEDAPATLQTSTTNHQFKFVRGS